MVPKVLRALHSIFNEILNVIFYVITSLIIKLGTIILLFNEYLDLKMLLIKHDFLIFQWGVSNILWNFFTI